MQLQILPIILVYVSVINVNGSSNNKITKKDSVTNSNVIKPNIYQMRVETNVINRFASTTVTNKLQNSADTAQETTVFVIIPEDALISAFIMEMSGKNYTSRVKEKHDTNNTNDDVVSGELPVTHLATVRDSKRVNISVTIAPHAKVSFYLTYEELVKRRNGYYEIIANLYPGQLVEDLSVQVSITDDRNLINPYIPPLRSGNAKMRDELDPETNIIAVNETSVIIEFSPNLETQKEVTHRLGTKEKEGFAGQFVVQYDVEGNPTGGDIFIQDGYFVHFFTPSKLNPLPKHVVFVLDTDCYEYCMTKMYHLKGAIYYILDQLNDNDLFHLVEYNSAIKVWDINDSSSSVTYKYNNSFNYWQERLKPPVWKYIMKYSFPKATTANKSNVQKAKTIVTQFEDGGSEDIHGALTVALRLIKLTKEASNENHQPIIVLLSRGEPSAGKIKNPEEIITNITKMNADEERTPIIVLSFACNVGKHFLQKLAYHNYGFYKQIYEASDTAVQLLDFYEEISLLLLTNITFRYTSLATNLTETQFPVLFDGSEIVVAGYHGNTDIKNCSSCAVDASSSYKSLSFKPNVYHSNSNTERIWAYLMIKQLLQKSNFSSEGAQEFKTEAKALAFKYSFLTPVTSLVVSVTKPNSTVELDIEVTDEVIQPEVYNYPEEAEEVANTTPMETETDQPDSYASTLALQTKILTTYPWLQGFLHENGTITLLSVNYKLGLIKTISDVVDCRKTPNGTSGYCTLLADCPSVHSLLTSIDVFQDYFCILRIEYVGICCPSLL